MFPSVAVPDNTTRYDDGEVLEAHVCSFPDADCRDIHLGLELPYLRDQGDGLRRRKEEEGEREGWDEEAKGAGKA